MHAEDHKKNQVIHSKMIVLDIVSTYKETLPVFKKYDEIAKECICCNALFESLQHVSDTYNISMEELMQDLEQAIISDK